MKLKRITPCMGCGEDVIYDTETKHRTCGCGVVPLSAIDRTKYERYGEQTARNKFEITLVIMAKNREEVLNFGSDLMSKDNRIKAINKLVCTFEEVISPSE